MKLRKDRTDPQPVKRFKRCGILYIRYQNFNVASAREWDFTAQVQVVLRICAVAPLSGNTARDWPDISLQLKPI